MVYTEHHFKGKKVARTGRNPKVHGEIAGFPVGSSWYSRMECSQAGVHAPLRAGIHGSGTDGAYSIVLSGGYEDDEDNGDTITYTGQGGRSNKNILTNVPEDKLPWDGTQNADQEWVMGNLALKASCATKNPVRVVRGHTLSSLYAPREGYRYDGLYIVDKAWRAVGKTGFYTCRFAFKRLPDQPPVPKYPFNMYKFTKKTGIKSESEVGGSQMSIANPSTIRSPVSNPPKPISSRSAPSVTTDTAVRDSYKPSSLPTPKLPLLPISLGKMQSRSNVTAGNVQKSMNKSPMPSSSNLPLDQINILRSHPKAVVSSAKLLKREGNDHTLPDTQLDSSGLSSSGTDPRRARTNLSTVTPLRMIPIQRTLKRPRGERVINIESDGTPVKRLKVNPNLESTPQASQSAVVRQRVQNF